MKHIQSISRSPVQRAEMSTGEILMLVATILSAIAGLLVTISSVMGEKS